MAAPFGTTLAASTILTVVVELGAIFLLIRLRKGSLLWGTFIATMGLISIALSMRQYSSCLI